MKPRGTLMIEHRLIEKMLKVVEKEIPRIQQAKIIDAVFIDTAVDFIRIYADRTHHGKEEDILFKALDKKELSAQHKKDMQDLVDEHVFARKTVKELVEAKTRFLEGDKLASEVVAQKLITLVQFYPQHIRKEDKAFFPNTERYFTPAELDKMLEEFWEFDRKMIHEKYRNLVTRLEQEKK
jgi:hemerythrin-like domain-containing protein